MQKLFARLHVLALSARDEDGQTMAEYAVILAVITVGIVAALAALSSGISGAIGDVVSRLTP
jgi:Flp pilus assembly pilin Flp